ncbi:DUF4184 family protein [Psychrobacter sp. S1-30-MNA-CIBAN-0213]|uniref:DUF4184 family protein n=1 Tax=unclassified Psychrobacter TaxID=196806 RepID=UPI003320CA26
MAFTPAHMAAALPFYPIRRWLQFEALLIGTMMPDLHYYLNIPDSFSRQSHEWAGLLTYCLPWGLLVFALWYWLLKPAAFALIEPFIKGFRENPYEQRYEELGTNLSSRERQITGYTPRYWSFAGLKKRTNHLLSSFWPTVVFGLILGAATHLVWDGITHADGFIAQRIDWLQYPLYFYPFKGTTISRLLQYLSSMAGLLALFWFALVKFKSWQRSNHGLKSSNQVLDRQAEDSVTKPVLARKHSLLIVNSIAILSILWNMDTFLRWYPSLTSSPYTFAAKVLVSLLQDVAILCIGYAVIYHLIYLSRYAFRKK